MVVWDGLDECEISRLAILSQSATDIYIYIYQWYPNDRVNAGEFFFFQINTLKIFKAIKAGVGLGFATLLKTTASVSYILIRIAFI